MTTHPAILFLDDDPTRGDSFLKRFPDTVWVTTAADCIEELQKHSWPTVCLDHDLGGEVYVDSNREDCGMEVVRWLENHDVSVGQIIIHSYNFYAVGIMKNVLVKAGYDAVRIPFADLIKMPK